MESKKHIETIERKSGKYPRNLASLGKGTPERLYALGDACLLNDGRRAVCIAGPRRASNEAVEAARELARTLTGTRTPLALLSIGAHGVDQVVLEEYLDILEMVGKRFVVPPTVFVAYGLDQNPFPMGLEPLFTRVLADGGCIVSAEKPGTPPIPANFRKRAKLAAALADLTVFVECAEQSGTWSMWAEADRLGRATAALRVKPDDGRTGTEPLIANGCQPIESAEEFGKMLKGTWSKSRENELGDQLDSVLLAIAGAVADLPSAGFEIWSRPWLAEGDKGTGGDFVLGPADSVVVEESSCTATLYHSPLKMFRTCVEMRIGNIIAENGLERTTRCLEVPEVGSIADAAGFLLGAPAKLGLPEWSSGFAGFLKDARQLATARKW